LKPLRASRREVLASAGFALAGNALLPGTSAANSMRPTLDDAALLVLQDPHLPVPADVQRQLDGQGARVVALETDPVRMWRGPQAQLLAARHTRLLGVTSWPNFLMVRGLAEESGRRVRYQRLDAASGAMIWLIV
jgi:hypothetical protein